MSAEPSASYKGNDIREAVFVEEIELGPRESRRIRIGKYRQGDPKPRLTVRWDPDIPDAVGHSELVLTGDTFYVLLCQFESFVEVPVHVTVRYSLGEGSERNSVRQRRGV